MTRTAYTFTAVCLLAFALAAPTQALHCNGDITTIHAGVETFYIDDRSEPPGNIWIYVEGNGIEGLQSGTSCSFHSCQGPGPFDTRDPCWHPDHDHLLL